MEKDLTVGLLLEFYGVFLTENQRDILEMYYAQDCSLAEIAQDTGTTRQGVLDAVRRGEARLKAMEGALHLMQKHVRLSGILKRCRELAGRLERHPAEAAELKALIAQAQGLWEDKNGV